MKLKGFKFLLLLLFLFTCPITVLADDAAIYEIKIDAKLLEDGSANITETWDVNVTSGTEYYIVHENMNDISISNLNVSDENGTQFETIEPWDIDASINQKAYKYGIVKKSNGYEICWGIAEYGRHTYTINYNLSNFVASYSDYDGFYYQFIADSISPSPENISITVSIDGKILKPNNSRVWSFGFNGESVFQNGEIFTQTTENFKSKNIVEILVQLDKGLVSPTKVSTDSLESIKDKAIENSTYSFLGTIKDNLSEIIGLFVFIAFVVLITGTAFYLSTAKLRYYRKFTGNKNYMSSKYKNNIKPNKNIPLEGDFEAIYYILNEFNETPNLEGLLNAYFTRWDSLDYIAFNDIGISEPAMIFNNVKPSLSESEAELYYLLQSATRGSNVLTEEYFEKWSTKNSNTIVSWKNNILIHGENFMIANKLINSKHLNKDGLIRAEEVFGFKNYLIGLVKNNANQPMDSDIWSQLLSISYLFKVQVKAERSPDDRDFNYFITNMYYYNSNNFASRFSRVCNKSVSAEQSRSSGGGGSSSSSGGGGSSGGGSGGGSR